MKCYYLLRSNNETGPFSLKELRKMGLCATDLVWIEGESTSWQHPGSIDELKDLPASVPAAAKKLSEENNQQTSFLASEVPSFSNRDFSSTYQPANRSGYGEPAWQKPSFEELKRKYEEKLPQRKTRMKDTRLGSALFGFIVLMVGALMIGMVLQDALNKIRFPAPMATSVAREITGEKNMRNNASHAAYTSDRTTAQATAGAPVLEAVASTVQTTNTYSASTHLSPKLPSPVGVKEDKLAKQKNEAKLKLAARAKADSIALAAAAGMQKQAIIADESDNTSKTASTDEEKKASGEDDDKLPASAKLVLTANDYKKGLLGGVSDLQLTVKNPTAKNVDKATIEVEYLKPNGKVVQTQTLEVNDLTAGSSKTVDVPGSNRGVSVRYRVLNR